jgi:hypothetical protein
MAVFQYYSRRGCHLCEIMLEELLALIRGKAEIEYRDIDSQPHWRAKYDVRIPVVEYDGRLISEYPLDHSSVHAILRVLPENHE